ncbi:M56 family metallopeptidase [Brevibacterium marinum]|uniref:Zn-dependent protease with chaperone function n=1 Tax=Brevibacterium marinum TaxID=418643 RepID=A0A846S2E0_9MICO|nr:M56 family metallopeptidase [Brevibacterium marinum]NJC56311.1 Zn-dependent protease with chaperone function [Brevibacterium marinum]
MLISAIVLLVSAAVVFFVSPFLLSVGQWQSRRPGLALSGWLAALAGGLVLSTAAVVALVVGALQADRGGAGPQALVPWIIGWMALAVVGIVLALVLSASDDFGRKLKAEARVLRSRWTGWYVDSAFRIVTVDDDKPYACSLAGRPPEIYLSAGLRRLLAHDECAAIIAHEKSHIAHRHNLVLRTAVVNSACLPPRLPVSERFRASVLTLVEMVADDDAVRATSAESVRNALEALGDDSSDSSLRLRSLRLERIHLMAG